MAAQNSRIIAQLTDIPSYSPGKDLESDNIDFFLTKDSNSVHSKLYEEAILQQKSLQTKEELAVLQARRSSNKIKCNKTSLRLASQKRSEQIDEAVAMFSDVFGEISKDALLFILEKLEVIRKLKSKFYSVSDFVSVKAGNSRECQEANFLNLSWNFLNPNLEKSISHDLVYDFLAILFLSNAKTYALKQLNSEIRDSSYNISPLVSLYNTLNLDKLAYKQSYPKKQSAEPPKFAHRPSLSKLSLAKAENQSLVIPRHESLYLKHKEKTDKIQARKEQLDENETKDCTFAPKLVARHKLVSRKRSSCATDNRPTEEQEFDRCSFKPEIYTTKVPTTNVTKPRGFSDNVERMRKAFKAKEEQKELLEKVPVGENYEKLRHSNPKPFELLNRVKKDKVALVYVDVNLANGKKGRIGLHADDNPGEVARNFCRTFTLGMDTQHTLQELLKQQLISALHNN